jgi:hypothetical protein
MPWRPAICLFLGDGTGSGGEGTGTRKGRPQETPFRERRESLQVIEGKVGGPEIRRGFDLVGSEGARMVRPERFELPT